jgi:hypothetical protein
MKWRVMVELTGSDGTVRAHEVSASGGNTAECSAATVGLTLADGKRTLAGLQDHLVQAQAEEYCRQRRRCSHCGSQRLLKDVRARRLLSLFGTVEVPAPRFSPCRCAVTHQHTLNPIAEIMPDRCTPEYERLIAKMGSLLPYARARTLMSEFLPLADIPSVETTRRRTMRVGARLEQQAVVSQPPAPAAEAQAIVLSIDGGHVRSVRSYQVRSFEVMLAQVSNDDGKQVVFSSMPAEADRQREQLRGVLHGLGATPATPVTILSDGADGPRSLGEAQASVQHITSWTGFILRCVFSTLPRRSKAGRTRPSRIVAKAPALQILSTSTSVGACGTVRCSGLLISSATLLAHSRPWRKRRHPWRWRRVRWPMCFVLSRPT